MSARLVTGPVAILGFGNQGAAQAQNLRDAGASVIVGARAGGASAARAQALGFEVQSLADATRRAAVVSVLIPDEAVPAEWSAIAGALVPGAGVVFAHGFNLLYSSLEFPDDADVVLVSPTAPGRVLRMTVEVGERLPAYVAVHRDATGAGKSLAEGYAARIGCGPLWPTTVREETEVDLFGEQAVLCGGLNALVVAAFETLTAAGYAPEIAYLECVHQLKYLADLLHERGPTGFRRGISGTALYGDVTRGPRVIGDASRREMQRVLEEIRSGAFAKAWLAEVAGGRRQLDVALAQAAQHPIEAARRRALGLDTTPSPDP